MNKQQQEYSSVCRFGLVITGLGLMSLALVLGRQADGLPSSAAISLFQRGLIVAGGVVAGAVFLVSCLCMRYIQPRWVLLWVVLVGMVCRLVLLPAPPVLSTDANRYLWDGTVWLHGYAPWRFSPAMALAGTDAHVPVGLHALAAEHRALIDRINHSALPTIYPPVSEAVFASSAWIAPGGMAVLKALLLLFDGGTAVLIALILRRLKLPPLWLLIYWWNPVVINAFANEAHLDAISLFFTALFFYLMVCDRAIGAGAALGLAIGAKFWPIVLAAVVLRKYWSQRGRLFAISAAALGTALLVLLPMLITGPPAFSSLSAYARYWQANDLVFKLLLMLWNHLLISRSAARIGSLATVVVICGVAAFILLQKPMDRVRAIRVGLLLVALIFLLSPTEFPWYYTWLVPMLAVCPRPSLILWSCTLGLYHWAYIGSWIIWAEHLPVILLFVAEECSPALRSFFDVAATPVATPEVR